MLPLFTWAVNTFGVYNLFPPNRFSGWYNAEFCFIFARYCDFTKEKFVPWNLGIDNPSRYPDLYAHAPAGSGWKNLIHYGQIINSFRFQRFDYGMKGNQERYGSVVPPLYDLSAIDIQMIIASGSKDSLADPLDVNWLLTKSPLRVEELVIF